MLSRIYFYTKNTQAAKRFAIPLIIFVAIGLFLSFKVLSMPNLVIGDNFHWTTNNINDIIGPKMVRESYLGDIGILSTFKSGFLFPLTYLFVSLSIPSTIVYPFIFYVLAMVTFYLFSKEFLKNDALRILVAVLYIVNPVTPYYYASIINAFSLVILPVGLMFFVRSLKELRSKEKNSFVRNMAFTALFLGLTVSANEQFILSVVLVSVFLAITFIVSSYKKCGLTKNFVKVCGINLSIFALVFFILCMPLVISISNIQSAPLSTYFQGPSDLRFIQTVQYTYQTVNLGTLMRLGGDSGAGLGNNSWYDSNIITNYFGYLLLGFFALSILVLVKFRNKLRDDRLFFFQSILLFVVVFIIILVMKNLTSSSISNQSLALILKTWESPIKLRVLLLISALTSVLLIFKMIELFSGKRKNVIIGLTLILLISTTIVYNSPWLINYAGETTLQEITDSAKWGTLYNQTYVDASSNVEQMSLGYRGIVLPFTHKTELYADPNTRVFQTVSAVTDETSQLISEGNVSWSKSLGLFSIKSLAVMNGFDSNEGNIFPKPVTYDMNYTLQQILSDKELKLVNQSDVYNLYEHTGYDSNKGILFPRILTTSMNSTLKQIQNDIDLTLISQTQNYSLYENPNALPLIYASNNYVFYDDVGTLKYAFPFVNFKELPVFLNQQDTIGQLTVPSSVGEGIYQLHALGLSNNNTDDLTVNIANGATTRAVQLGKQDFNGLSDYSMESTLSPGDQVKVLDSHPSQINHINDQILNYTEYPIGSYGSFNLDFKVNLLERGNMSFLSPRVLIDNGNEIYFVIFHDNGFVELAVLRDSVFYSAVIYQYAGYSLLNPNNSINVKITRLLDEASVNINGNQYLTFPVLPNVANVSLVSEKSMSKFSEINMTTSNILRLFAERKDYTQFPYTIQNNGPESSALTVSSNGKDFAVVSQYLFNNQRTIQNDLPSTSFRANVFFQGWIFNTTQALSNQEISIGLNGQQLSYGLTALSIIFAYAMLLYLAKPIVYIRIYQNLRSKIKKRQANE